MTRWRKRPVVVDAYRWAVATTDGKEVQSIPMWLAAASKDRQVQIDAETNALMIETLEGTMRADPGDWIIRGVKGEIYPCKPDIFHMTYEPDDSPQKEIDLKLGKAVRQ